jgi:rhamnogalacturonan acetylesterase
MEDAVKTFKSKGANVLVTSQTPNNPFNNPGSTPVYVSYAQQVAAQTGVAYVDHYSYLLKEYQTLGASVVNGLFPVDNIHTSSTGMIFFRDFSVFLKNDLRDSVSIKVPTMQLKL